MVEVKQRVADLTDSSVLQLSSEEIRAKTMEGYFVKDAERDLVCCPQSEILRRKSEKRSGEIRYCNKLACKRSANKCTKSKFKEADFSKDNHLRPAVRGSGGGEAASKEK